MRISESLEQLKEKPRYETKIQFIEGVYEADYMPVIAEKVKDYEVDGWKACLDSHFSPFKMLVEGKYLVSFVRKIEK